MTARRQVARLVAMVVVLYLAYVALVFGVQRRLIYPGHYMEFEPDALPAWFERWTITTDAGEEYAYWAPARGASAEDPAPAVILTHGNGDTAENLTWWIAHYHQAGFAVLAPEYRGFARAAGEPDEDAIADDISQFYDRLAARPDIDKAHIAFHGISLGGAVAAAVARRRPPAALVLQSTFESVPALASRFFVPGFLAVQTYATIDYLRDTDVPVLIVHGDDDNIVPVENARANAAVTKNVTLLIFQGRHLLPRKPDVERYWKAVFGHLRKAGFRVR